MLPINFPVVLLSALIPLLMGFIWYHPKVFGNIWMRESGIIPNEARIRVAFNGRDFQNFVKPGTNMAKAEFSVWKRPDWIEPLNQ